MNTERIKEIQQATAYPNSKSVQQALLQVWHECSQEQIKPMTHTDKQPQTENTEGTIFQFLDGSHSYNGKWFGDYANGVPFWWRRNLREELEALKAEWQMEQWVSVEDRLPEESENVLMHYELVNKKGIKYFATYLGFYYYGDWKFAESGDVVKDRNVTHWMPLPPAPNTKP